MVDMHALESILRDCIAAQDPRVDAEALARKAMDGFDMSVRDADIYDLWQKSRISIENIAARKSMAIPTVYRIIRQQTEIRRGRKTLSR